jgi:hypothetical protein
LPFSFVYQHPTITALSLYLVGVAGGAVISNGTSNHDAMIKMAAEMSKNWPEHKPSLPVPETETVLLTGSTGGFGSYLLARLLDTPSVSRVFALNRSGQKDVRTRQVEMFEDRGLDASMLDSPKLVYVEGDTSKPDLGIPATLYDDIRSSVTTIFHNGERSHHPWLTAVLICPQHGRSTSTSLSHPLSPMSEESGTSSTLPWRLRLRPRLGCCS